MAYNHPWPPEQNNQYQVNNLHQAMQYDAYGNRVTDRNILQQLEFEPFTGTKQTINVEVDNSTNDAIIEPLEVNININTQR